MKIGRCIDVGWAFNMGCHICEELTDSNCSKMPHFLAVNHEVVE